MNRISKINLFDEIDSYCYSNLNKFIKMKINSLDSFKKIKIQFVFFRIIELW